MPKATKNRETPGQRQKRIGSRAAPTKTAEKLKAKPTSLITFLLDRSGSMQACRDSTISAFNAYLSGLKEEQDAEINFTFLQFDDQSLDKCCVNTPIAVVPNLTPDTFIPRAMTPLIDAAVLTIQAVDAALYTRCDKPRVVVCIQTDGQENRSLLYNAAYLRNLVAEKTAAGWEFNFMGAGIEGYDQATQYGISSANTISYDVIDSAATQTAFYASAANSRDFSAGRMSNTQYSLHQKAASGDKFAEKWDRREQAK